MTSSEFIDALTELELPSVFNPYRDRCTVYDYPDAAERRRRNLRNYIEAVRHLGVDSVWVARDLGYRGGRRTGIPLTDEIHLGQASRLLGGITLSRATRGQALRERTATAIWRVVNRIAEPVMFWNVFPFHPHEPNEPFSNRRHTLSEHEAASAFLPAFIELIQPKRIIAIGQDAQRAFRDNNIDVMGVRHPSYGGQRDFETQILSLYS